MIRKQVISVLVAVLVLLVGIPMGAQAAQDGQIVILYENDVHCAIEGYAKLSAMKTELSQTVPHVGVVSVGDFVQGSSLGVISQGEYIVNIMNLVGYDAVTLGNHEFDYRIPRLLELAQTMHTKPICSNFQKIGAAETVFEPYSIVSYGDVDIAYIGVTTPDTVTSSAPAQFKDENGEFLYTFHGNDLYDTVQKNIDAAKQDGADVVIALTHLGTENVYEQWSAPTLVENTTGLDVVLDAHSHSVVESMTVTDASGEEVVISSTGTQFANIGKLTIDGDTVTTELIKTETYEKTDDDILAYIAQINEEYQALGERKIGASEVFLTTVDENGDRIIRNNETNLGDFCADAFRVVTDADIGFINGGGIRANLDEGDITFNDILSVYPWNNVVCVARVTGQAIVDMLELGLLNYPEEDGSFQHVSGVTFAVNTAILSSVELDENLSFVKVGGEYRVHNVKVLNRESGEYEPIDLEKEYTLCSHSHLLLEQGGGASMFRDVPIIMNNGMLDVELLEIFITENLGGVIGNEYAESQNRIRFVNGFEQEETPTTTTTVTSATTAAPTLPDSPKTADNAPFTAAVLLAVAAAAIVCVKKYGKKHTCAFENA